MFNKIGQSMLLPVCVICALVLFQNCVLHPAISSAGAGQEEFVLVEDGVSRAPIVIFEDAPPLTRQAAEELAYYIEKTSGARPEIIEGEPDPVPESAVWVGYQPLLEEVFPDLDFEFQNHEEILIAANAQHLVIAGRDRWDPENLAQPVRFGSDFDGFQFEYGTHNAVYTFLHDHLGVRWFWPGELGEDVLDQPTLTFEPFTYRYHPQVRARNGLFPWTHLHRTGPGSPEGLQAGYWARAHRLQLSSFLYPPSCHGPWAGMRDQFLETHPEFLALQPDGTRSGYSHKVCHSNPALAEWWLDYVAARLEENPNQRVFNAAPADGWLTGHCVCEDCLAWDHLEGEPRQFSWKGVSQRYVALSDRDVTFANRVARGLKERFPDKDLYVYTLAYGPSRSAPIETVPDDNVIIGNVANFLLRSDLVDRGSIVERRMHRENFGDWGRVTNNNFWRPNTGSPVGWLWGMPDVPLTRTIEDMQFAAENGWMGIYVDYNRHHWATQGPMNYLMAQLTWNPHQDGHAVLEDYYRRAFGPAAEEMQEYWTYMEKIREECYGTENSGRSDHDLFDFYNTERLGRAQDKLDRALERAADGPEVYRERIDFVQTGLHFTRLTTECGRLVRRIEKDGDPDGDLRAQIDNNWDELRALRQKHPGAVLWRMFLTRRGDDISLHGRVPRILAP